jgi:site-specific recombinase XerD
MNRWWNIRMPDSRKHASDFISYIRDQRGYSPNTVAAYEKDIHRFQKYLWDKSVGVSELHRRFGPVIREFNRRLGVEGLSNRSICRVLSTIRSYFKYLARQNITSEDLGARIMGLRFEKKLPRFLLESDVERLMEFPDPEKFIGARDLALIELLYSTGCRLDEIISVRFDDLDIDNNCVRVMGKRRRERIAPIGKYAHAALRNYLHRRMIRFPDNLAPELFLNQSGRPLSRRAISRVVRKYTAMLGTGDPASPHMLRHSFATHLLDHGADIMAIKEMLGHSSLSSTQEYSSVTLRKLRDAYDKAHPRA